MFPIFLLNFPKTLRVYQPTTLIPYHRLRQKLVKKLTTKEKLWHASQNGCMVNRSHVNQWYSVYIAVSLRKPAKRKSIQTDVETQYPVMLHDATERQHTSCFVY